MKNLRYFILGVFVFLLTNTVIAQAPAPSDAAIPEDTETSTNNSLWKTLSKITYKKQYDEIMGFKVDVPVFSPSIKALEGKEVTVKGYIIPVEGYKSHTEFVFSAFPYNMCFFCGGAGPETVMEVQASEPVAYSAEPVILKGILELNDSDINRLIYAIKDAVKVGE